MENTLRGLLIQLNAAHLGGKNEEIKVSHRDDLVQL